MPDQDKLQSWSEPFREALQGRSGARWFDLSLVESVVRVSLELSMLHPLELCAQGVYCGSEVLFFTNTLALTCWAIWLHD